MRIALYGGAFSPPHKSHLEIADKLTKHFDEVWVLPCNKSLHNKKLLDNNIRLQLLKLSKQNYKNEKIVISAFELNNNTDGSSYNILELLNKTYNNTEFTLILGTDNANMFSKFRNANKIIEKYDINVISRENEQNTHNFKILPIKVPGYSSTQVKKAFKENDTETLKKVLDKNVLEHIIETKINEEM